MPMSGAERVLEGDVVAFAYDTNPAGGLQSGGTGEAIVQNQSLVFGKLSAGPTNSSTITYPFARIAWLNESDTGGVAYVYHQINESFLAEEMWLLSVGWHMTYIKIGST